MSEELASNIRRAESWRRVLLMLLFSIIYWVASWLLGGLVFLQAGWLLIAGRNNSQMARFGASLGDYLRRIVCFLTGATEHLPFPFTEWPASPSPESVLGPPGSASS